MKRGPHPKEKKSLSFSGLLGSVREAFDQINGFGDQPERGRKNTISLSDALMSALAMFGMKAPSLLAFETATKDPTIKSNLLSLYHVENIPSDTHMRRMLDEVDPRVMRPAFLDVFHEVQRGKLLERYEYMGGYLLLVDGTEIFNSEDVHCSSCCEKHHKDGRITYHHQMLGAVLAHPECSQVIPLCPEPITKPDGATKNDCERNAFRRFLKDLKKEHPRLKLTICSDALSANAPHISELQELEYDYIINVKPEGNRSLFEWIKGQTREIKWRQGVNHYIFRYVNGVPLNNTEGAPEVNFLECEAVELRGKTEIRKRFTWVTSHKITDLNVYELMCGGRARWKIENETYNTLKNQGYQFEHNFGHGEKYLHTVFAYLMMLAFLIDQIQEATCGLFKAALEKVGSRKALWDRMRSFFYTYRINAWIDLLKAIGTGFHVAELIVDTC